MNIKDNTLIVSGWAICAILMIMIFVLAVLNYKKWNHQKLSGQNDTLSPLRPVEMGPSASPSVNGFQVIPDAQAQHFNRYQYSMPSPNMPSTQPMTFGTKSTQNYDQERIQLNPRVQAASYNQDNIFRNVLPRQRYFQDQNRFEDVSEGRISERQQNQALPPPQQQQQQQQQQQDQRPPAFPAGAIARVAVNGLNANIVERAEQQQ